MESVKYDVYTREGAAGPEMVVHNQLGVPDSVNTDSLLIYTDVLQTDDDGFPTPEEKAVLDHIGDALEDAVLEVSGVSVGRVVSPKQAMWLFYIAPSYDSKLSLEPILAATFPERLFTTEQGDDSLGNLAASYFPKIESGQFNNQERGDQERLLRHLSENAGRLRDVMVCYKASFAQRSEARAFKHAVEAENFTVTFCGSSASGLWLVNFKRMESLEESAQLSLLSATEAQAACHHGKLEEWKIDKAEADIDQPVKAPLASNAVRKSAPPNGAKPARVAASEAREAYFAGNGGGMPRIEISGWAVACFAMGLLNLCGLLSVPSIICGVIARRHIKRSEGQRIGNTLALAGMIISSIVLLFAVFYLILLGFGLANGFSPSVMSR
jgi:hypothetical protein